VKREDVRVVQPRGEPNLSHKSLAPKCLGEVGAQHLDGNFAVVPDIVRKPNRCHSPSAELALDTVAASEALLK
jgi:hypothetical protein